DGGTPELYWRDHSFKAAMPATTLAAPATRRQPKPSLSQSEPMSAAKRTEVSRSAATAAIGARVIAQSTMPYASKLHAPPPSPARQQPRKYEKAVARRRATTQTRKGMPSTEISQQTYASALPDARAPAPSTSV